MKRILSCLFVLLILVGCSNNKAVTVEEVKKIEEVNTKYDYEKATCLVSDGYLIYKSFNRGDEVKIIGQDDSFVYILDNDLVLAIDINYVRDNKEVFEEYEAYTYRNAKAYKEYDLNNEVKSFSLNDKVKVIDSVGDILLIDLDGQVVYMNKSKVSKSKISEYVAPKQETTTPSVPSGPSNPSIPTPSSEDGEDIQLSYTSSSVSNDYKVDEYVAKVLVDDVDAYFAFLNRDDEVCVLSLYEDYYYVVFEGRVCKIEKAFVRKADEVSSEAWTGYVDGSSNVYSDYARKSILAKFKTNDSLEIIDEVNDTYIVKLSDGNIGYIDKNNVSKNKIVITPKQEVTPTPSPNTGGSGTGGSQPTSEPEWTEEKL